MVNAFGVALVRDPQILNTIPCKARYHQKFYIRYTDKSKIEGIRKKPSAIPQKVTNVSKCVLLFDDVTFLMK